MRTEKNCNTCANFKVDETSLKESCKEEPRMTFTEYEDYFIDHVLPCRFYKRRKHGSD